ncbi:hypothetical protein [Allocoleopsis sp.]|uniref:hypothetical protein n=1 Tax=Allocoleopsis sp. TaxID=3088169 RepID=UPI002FD1801A
MSTYTEIQQQLQAAQKITDAAVEKITTAKEVTDEMRNALTGAVAYGVQLRSRLSQLLEKEAKALAQQINLKRVDVLYRGRRYSVGGEWYVYYEKCHIVERKPNYVTVESKDFGISGFYKGGRFRIKCEEIQYWGKAYHSRHGDFFYLSPLSDSSPLPGSVVIGGGLQPRSQDVVLGTPHRNVG